MKDRNGFTLPETLAVITVLAIILVLAASTAVRLLDQTKKRITEYDKKILNDTVIIYGEDLDKNNQTYKLTEDVTLNSGETLTSGTEVKGYKFKELVNKKNTLPVKTLDLYEMGYMENPPSDPNGHPVSKIDCTAYLEFETSIQDGYIVINKISAKLGDDCK